MLENKKRIALMIAVLMLVLSFSTTGFASWLDKTIKASYRNITIAVNGVTKTAKNVNGVVVEPFIVDGTTYVPLRGIADILGYQVSFNPTTYKIDITGGDVAQLTATIAQQQATIKSLETQLAQYKTMTIAELEAQLLKDYDDIYGVEVMEYDLRGDKSAIEVRVYIDLRNTTDTNEWNAISSTKIRTHLQSVVDLIKKSFKDAKITGYIENEYNSKKLVNFTTNTSGTVSLVTSSSVGDIEDLIDELNSRYGIYRNIEVDFEVTEDSRGDLYVDMYVTSGTIRSLGTDRTERNTRIESYLNSVCSYIFNNYSDDINIEGVFWDDTDEIEFTYDYFDKLDWLYR